MKILRKAGRFLLKIVLGIVLFILSYVLIAMITTLIPVNTGFKKQVYGNEIFVSSNGVHINIVLPVKSEFFDWSKFLKTGENCKYLAFGWGDKDFYMNTPTWADLKIGIALKAAFWPTDAVMQVYTVSSEPISSDLNKRIFLNNEQFRRLNSYIRKSFVVNEKGEPKELIPEKSPGDTYRYYMARGKYTIFFTCNNWAGRGLKYSGVKNALWAPFDKSVLYHLK